MQRNGSGQTTVHNLWGPGAFRGRLGTWPAHDQNYGLIVFFERNGDPSIGNDTNPDNTAGGESSETPADKRYFYVFDRTAAPVAMTNYTSGGGGSNGQIAERYSRGPHAGRIIQRGDSGSGEGGGMVAFSPIGNSGLGQTLPCSQIFGGSLNAPPIARLTAGGGNPGGGGPCSGDSPTEPPGPGPSTGPPNGPCFPGQIAWGGGCIPENVDPTSLAPPQRTEPRLTPADPGCGNNKENQACAAKEGMDVDTWCARKHLLHSKLTTNFPGPFDAACAWEAGENAVKAIALLDVLGFHTNDKWKHCFAGCHIACMCNVEAGCYAGIADEYRDLTDCDPGSTYDWLDITATCDGATLGGQSQSGPNCDQACFDGCVALYP